MDITTILPDDKAEEYNNLLLAAMDKSLELSMEREEPVDVQTYFFMAITREDNTQQYYKFTITAFTELRPGVGFQSGYVYYDADVEVEHAEIDTDEFLDLINLANGHATENDRGGCPHEPDTRVASTTD
jgi:hypothetical protein